MAEKGFEERKLDYKFEASAWNVVRVPGAI
jgi:hypothetical protein